MKVVKQDPTSLAPSQLLSISIKLIPTISLLIPHLGEIIPYVNATYIFIHIHTKHAIINLLNNANATLK